MQGNSHKHENSKDSEAKVSIHDVLDKRGRKGMGSQISEVRMSDLQVVEEEENTHSR